MTTEQHLRKALDDAKDALPQGVEATLEPVEDERIAFRLVWRLSSGITFGPNDQNEEKGIYVSRAVDQIIMEFKAYVLTLLLKSDWKNAWVEIMRAVEENPGPQES